MQFVIVKDWRNRGPGSAAIEAELDDWDRLYPAVGVPCFTPYMSGLKRSRETDPPLDIAGPLSIPFGAFYVIATKDISPTHSTTMPHKLCATTNGLSACLSAYQELTPAAY